MQIPEVGLHKGYLECYHWADMVVFQYEPTKHGDAQKAKLARFAGTQQVDAESRYDQVFGDRISEAGCNAHGRRKFRDAEEGGRWVSAWFDIEEEAQDARLAGEELRSWRDDRIRPLVRSSASGCARSDPRWSRRTASQKCWPTTRTIGGH